MVRPVPASARREGWLLAVFSLVFTVYVAGSVGIVGANPSSHYALVRALGDEGRCQVDSYIKYTHWIDLAYKDGHHYSNKPPGNAALALPFYLAGRAVEAFVREPAFRVGLDRGRPAAVFVLLLPALAGALSVVLVARMALALGASAPAAGGAALMLALGTLHWRYGTAFYAHAVSGALVTGACFVCLRASDLRRQGRSAFLLGLLLGAAAAADYVHALVLPIVVVYLLAEHKLGWPGSRTEAIRLLAGPAGLAIPMLFLATYGTACFGSPIKTAYDYATSPDGGAGVAQLSADDPLPGFSAPLARGLSDLLFGGGEVQWPLLWTSPVLVAWLPGIWLLARRSRAAAWLIGATPLLIVLVMAKFRAYWGGHVADGRYIVPALPLLILPVAFAAEGLRSALERRRPMAIAAACVLVLAGARSMQGAAEAAADFDGHPVRELTFAPGSVTDITDSLAALFPSLWHAPLALGAIALGLALFGSLLPGTTSWPASRRVALALGAALTCCVPLLRPVGGPLRIGRYSISEDGSRWRSAELPVSLDPGRTLWLRAVMQAPTNVSEVILEAGDACVVEARVNKVPRLFNKHCPPAPEAARFSATAYLVPGPNLVELELRAGRVSTLVRPMRVEP